MSKIYEILLSFCFYAMIFLLILITNWLVYHKTDPKSMYKLPCEAYNNYIIKSVNNF